MSATKKTEPQVMTARDTKREADRINYEAILADKWGGPAADAFKKYYEAKYLKGNR